MNGVQTRFKCKLDVKRCKRFVFPPSSLLPRSNALKTKAIRYFQTDRTLTRIVSPPLQWFPEEHILIMKEAVEDHRASNKHVPRSIYGKIVAEADRIIDPDITLRRTVQYGLSNYPELDKEKQYIRFLTHLKEKYAEGGYLRLWIPQSANAVHLQELRQLIADEEELHKVFEKIYSQETETIQNLENIPIFVRNKKNNSI